MRSKMKAGTQSQRREEKKANENDCAAAHSLVAQANSCANPSQPPECPASSNYFLYATQENLRGLAERNQAAILARIVDCPKPEFVEYACAPKKKGCNSKGKNHTRTKEQSSQKDAL